MAIQLQLFEPMPIKERIRLLKRGLNCRIQMEACNWPVTDKLLMGFLEAQTQKYGKDIDIIKWELKQIVTDIQSKQLSMGITDG